MNHGGRGHRVGPRRQTPGEALEFDMHVRRAVHAAQVCAASVKRVDGVDWMDLGSPEAIWHLWVEDFMAIVTMDAHGQSLHKQVLAESKERLAALKA